MAFLFTNHFDAMGNPMDQRGESPDWAGPAEHKHVS
jgi:hypothetical protein